MKINHEYSFTYLAHTLQIEDMSSVQHLHKTNTSSLIWSKYDKANHKHCE